MIGYDKDDYWKDAPAIAEGNYNLWSLSDMLNKKIYQLSGGEQQRVAIIKLILQGSKIILADEPTSGLDKDNEAIVMRF